MFLALAACAGETPQAPALPEPEPRSEIDADEVRRDLFRIADDSMRGRK